MIARARRSTPAKVVAAYGGSQASNFAAGLAFNAFMAMFPLILGLLSLLGVVVRDPNMQARVQDAITSIFPSDAHAEMLRALQGVKHSAGILGVVSILGLLWSGTSLFGSMEFALTQIFGSTQRDAVRQRLMGLVMMVVFLAAVVAAVVANSAAAATALGGILGIIVAAAVLIGLMCAIYRFVPNRTFALRDVVPGAVLAGACIEILTLVFPLYARLAHGFNTYGQQFALFFVLGAWLGFLMQCILLGAVFNRMRLGVPTDEGLFAAPDDESHDAPRPVDAIRSQQQPDGPREVVGRRESTAPASGHPTSREVKTIVGAAAVTAAIGVVVSRVRRR